MLKWVLVATIMFVYALGIEAQGVLTTDAMIRVAEQKTKVERMAVDGKRLSPAQQPVMTLVVKVADEHAADTYARLREQGVTIRGRIGQQAIVQVPLDKVEAIAQVDGVLRVDVGHKGELKTDVSREVTGVNLLNGSHPTVPSPFTGKGVTVCVIDIGLDFNHPAYKDAQGRSRIKCVYNTISDKGRKFVYDDPVAGTIEFPGSVFDTPELISKLVYDTKLAAHGGHTTGIAAGSLSPQGFGGMAPDADIVYLALGTLFTEDDVDTDTGITAESETLQDPDPTQDAQTHQILEQHLAFANAYAQQSDQPMVLSASLGSHMGPHDGTGTVPEAVSALSKTAIPVFASSNEGGSGCHVYYQFAEDKPSFSVGLLAFPTTYEPEDADPDYPFYTKFSNEVRGYTRPGQGGEISLSKKAILDYIWSSPAVTGTLGGPDQMVTINSADYPEVEKYFRGKVYLAIRTLDSGRQELTIIPYGYCAKAKDGAYYALTITVAGSSGTAVDLWQDAYKFVPYVGEGYIIGDDVISANDWASTPDVISVGAWCANTTNRANEQGNEDQDQSETYTPGDIAYFMSGTSMACPTAAGIIALWLQANPKLTLADVKDILANSCDNDEFTAKNPIRWGYGKINTKKGLDYIQQGTGIIKMEDVRSMMEDVWYTLDGRRLMGQPTQRGIYINKGKKFIVK